MNSNEIPGYSLAWKHFDESNPLSRIDSSESYEYFSKQIIVGSKQKYFKGYLTVVWLDKLYNLWRGVRQFLYKKINKSSRRVI